MELADIPLFIYQIALCFGLSLLFLRNAIKNNILLTCFLLMLFIVEFYCAKLSYNGKPTNPIYNFWFPVEFIFYGYFVSYHISHITIKLFSKIALIVYFLFLIFYYSFVADLSVFSSVSFLLGCSILLFTLLFKLYEVINEEIVNNPLKYELFWFIIGLLFVNMGSYFHFGAVNYMYKNNNELHSALQQLNVYLSEFQYVCFIIYFICKWRYPK